MMSPGYQFDEAFAQQFILGGRSFTSADPRVSVFPEPFTDEELRSIQTPVLLLVGEREPAFDPRRAIAQAQRCIPQVETHLVPGSGHMIAMDAGDVLNAMLLHLLASG